MASAVEVAKRLNEQGYQELCDNDKGLQEARAALRFANWALGTAIVALLFSVCSLLWIL